MLNLPETGRIIGVGLNKTGTTTLGHALNALNIPTIDYPTDPRTLHQLEHGDYDLDILKTYMGVTDTPVGFFYPQLDKVYPGSKFILTVREKNSWLKSVRDHWPFVMEWSEHEENFKKFTYYAFISVYGSLHYNEDRYSYVYDHHVECVRQYFADRPGDLLIMDICAGEGWEKLCPFLGIPVPEEPFPHLNRREDKGQPKRWVEQLDTAIRELNNAVPHDATIIIVDEDQLGNSEIHLKRKAVPFTESDGVYNGPPADDDSASDELNRLSAKGAEYIAFAWPSFWWLDHYRDFASSLERDHELILKSSCWVLYRLKK